MDDKVIWTLRKIVGLRQVLTSHEDMVCYGYDAQHVERLPYAVVRPADAEQVAGIVLLANKEDFPLTPRGAGTGLSGGAIGEPRGRVARHGAGG